MPHINTLPYDELHNTIRCFTAAKSDNMAKALEDNFTPTYTRLCQVQSGVYVNVDASHDDAIQLAIDTIMNGKSCSKPYFFQYMTHRIQFITNNPSLGANDYDWEFFMPEGMNIIKYHVHIYFYVLSNDKIIPGIQNFLCYALTKELVDVDKIDRNDFIRLLTKDYLDRVLDQDTIKHYVEDLVNLHKYLSESSETTRKIEG